MYFVASTLTNGAPVSRASRRAISVLPTPVGPIIRIFLGAISARMASGKLLPPPAIAHGDRHGPFGVLLADDVLIELGHDLRGASGCAWQHLDHDVHVGENVDAGGDLQAAPHDRRGVEV